MNNLHELQKAIWNWILVIFSYSIIDLILKRRESMIDKISIDLIDSLLKEKKKKEILCKFSRSESRI